MANLIPKRYANAIFDIAIEENKVDLFYEEFIFLEEVFNNNKDLTCIINHPEVTKDEKMNIFDNVFKNKINDSILGLFKLMLRKNREVEITNVINYFLKKVRDYKKIVVAKVFSVFELSQTQIKNIADKLTVKLNKQVIIETFIDESLIGGLCIQVDGYMIDASIRKQLADIKSLLEKNQIV